MSGLAQGPGLRRPDRDAHYSPSSSVEVYNMWSFTSAPSIRLHGVALLIVMSFLTDSYFTLTLTL
jgi:hypothetical protein